MTVMERSLEGLARPSSGLPVLNWDQDDIYSEHLDPRTGEILTERRYQAWPWEPYPHDDANPLFETLTSLSQRDRFMEGIDKRKLVLHNKCRCVFDSDRGSSSLDNRRPMLSKPVYRSLDKLVRLLDYQNYLYTTADNLSEKLEIHPKSVTRLLRSLGSLARVRSAREGMRKGVLQIAVSPAYGYRMEPESINESRYTAFCNWYHPTSKEKYSDRFDFIYWFHCLTYPEYVDPLFLKVDKRRPPGALMNL